MSQPNCQALTKNGTQCQRKAVSGRLCKQHFNLKGGGRRINRRAEECDSQCSIYRAEPIPDRYPDCFRSCTLKQCLTGCHEKFSHKVWVMPKKLKACKDRCFKQDDEYYSNLVGKALKKGVLSN